MAQRERVVALIDLDCFYCACERHLEPSLAGVPIAVVQYNPFENSGGGAGGVGGVISRPPQPAAARVVARDGKILLPSGANGSIIAVSYEARARGVTRFFRGREALAACPELVLVQVPTAHGKSDMGIYREYGARVLKIVASVCGGCGGRAVLEKASVDEMYVDVTEPARAVLAGAPVGLLAREAAEEHGTHVAGATEAADEAGRGAQPGGVLARSSFRAGHAGQREREIGAASAAWWARPDGAWAPEEGLLAAGAAIVGRARAAVTAELGFTCSAGVAANKLLAKLCGGLHKPNQQTVLPPSAVHALLDPLPVDRLRGFGAKLGKLLREDGGFETCAALRRAGVPAVARLLRDGGWNKPEEMAAEAVRMAGGRDDAEVGDRKLSKQVGSGKQFGGRRGAARGPLDTREVIAKWVSELTGDIADRLAAEEEENDRVATKIIVGLGLEGEAYCSKRTALKDASADGLARDCLQLIASLTAGRPPTRIGITLLNITADGFESTAAAGAADRGALVRMFAAAAPAAAAAAAADSRRSSERGSRRARRRHWRGGSRR